MALCGLAVGWRIHDGAADAVAALGLLVAFQVAATWVGMYLGLVIGKEAQQPRRPSWSSRSGHLQRVVPTSGMPTWLHVIADWNPVSALATAARHLLGSPVAPANSAWPLLHPVTASLAWTALLLVVFVPLATARYARAT